MAKVLKIENLHANVEDKEILKGFNLEVKTGEIHAIMGPNGTGKSTLAATLMGHYKYTPTKTTGQAPTIKQQTHQWKYTDRASFHEQNVYLLQNTQPHRYQ